MLDNSQSAAKIGAADGMGSPSHARPNCHSYDSVITVCKPAASVRSSHCTAVCPVSTGRPSQCPLGISSTFIVSSWRKEHRQRQALELVHSYTAMAQPTTAFPRCSGDQRPWRKPLFVVMGTLSTKRARKHVIESV